MTRTLACLALALSLAATLAAGCSSAPSDGTDAAVPIDAPAGDGGARDSGAPRDGSHDTGSSLVDTGGGTSDAGTDVGPADVDAGDDASTTADDAGAIDDAGTDAAVTSDAGTDAGTPGSDAGTSMPRCTGSQIMCPCATGWYCAPRGSFCINPATPCP